MVHHRKNAHDARRLFDFGPHTPEPGAVFPQLAAHTVVASLTLNLKDALTHE